MKPAWAPIPAGIVLLLAILATAGCDEVLSTAQLPSVREDRILGEWKDLGFPGAPPEADPLSIRFANGAYRMGTSDEFAKGNETSFTLARAGHLLIAQVPAPNHCDEFGTKGQPCWGLYRLGLAGNRINWYDFDAQRLGRESFSGALDIAHSLHRQRKDDGAFDNTILLSADASGLQRFLDSYVKKRGVFRLTGRLERIR